MDERLPAHFYRRWYYYAIVTAYLPLTAGIVALGAVVDALIGGAAAGETLLTLLFALLTIVVTGAAIASLLGYLRDAVTLAESGADWQPRGWLWVLSHVILTPLVTCPVYLILRTTKTGWPPLVDGVIARVRS